MICDAAPVGVRAMLVQDGKAVYSLCMYDFARRFSNYVWLLNI